MDYIRFCINNPVKVMVAVILLLLFGFIAIFTIPIQLVPNVDQPVITVTTTWTGRSPEEIEREIVEEQEDKLKGVSSLRKMTATAQQGSSSFELEFYIGSDMTRALQEVSDKLREVPSYPDDVDQPVIKLADTASSNAIAWMIIQSDDPNFDIATLYDQADKRIKPYLERIPGVSESNIYGGREREVHIQVDPRRLAERGITFNQLRSALRAENINVSAGDLADGRLDIRVRTVGQYDNLDDVRNTIIAYSSAPLSSSNTTGDMAQDSLTGGGPIRVKDIATVELTMEKRRTFVHSKGRNAIAVNAIRESGANVVEVMRQLRQRVKEIDRDILPSMGPGLHITQVYDETVYIDDALQLVLDNLWQGGILVVIVLLLFLRGIRSPITVSLALVALVVLGVLAFVTLGMAKSLVIVGIVIAMACILFNSRPTAIIAVSIPLSIIGTFVVLTGAGRNLNVVSLAGLAFAIGMVVDNSIVVLENIDRHLNMGKTPIRAAYDGAKEVWAAILASTATTLVVFLPVLTLKEEAGQLFLDISLAICAAVALSLIVSVTVIPAAGSRWLRERHVDTRSTQRAFNSIFGIAPLLGKLRDGLADLIYFLCGSTLARLGIVAAFTVASIVGAYFLMPPTTYLPKGNRNLVFGVMFTPPAYNIKQAESIGERIEAGVRPYWEAKSWDETKKLPPAFDFQTQRMLLVPPIDNYFYVTFNGNIFMGASSADKSVVSPLGSLLTGAMSSIPGSFGFAQQASLFGRGVGGASSVDVELSSDDLTTLRNSAMALYNTLGQKYGFQGGVQPDPLNFNLASPELRVQIDRVRAADVGIDVNSLGLGVQALIDGAIVGDYREGGDSIDLLMVRDPDYPLTVDSLGQVPVAISPAFGGGTVPLSAVATIYHTDAPQTIKRIEQRRAITLKVLPSAEVPLEQVTKDIEAMIGPMRESGQISPGVEIAMAGTADKLSQLRESLLGTWHGWNMQSLKSLLFSRMFLALLVNYLVMCWLFNSFVYPFVIMFSVPLATVGGFLGLRLLHTFDPSQLLDVVTMLGFVILIGTVVNNAILIVAQSLNFMQGFGESEQDKLEKAMKPREAIRESVRTRLRPVLMTTVTTLFGMLPLVIKPGSGSELYRGLGSVVLGGLLISTLFTLIVVPLLFSLMLDLKASCYKMLGWEVAELLASDSTK
ncbi:MAG: hypothetical protein GC164_01450 [Phycisphaera sp.]|nr:hypothetical protein [Phycisphaera sp.]